MTLGGLGTALLVNTRCPSPCAAVGVETTGITVHVAPHRTAIKVAPPSVATSRSPSRTPAAARSADDRRRIESVPGCGLPAVLRSARYAAPAPLMKPAGTNATVSTPMPPPLGTAGVANSPTLQ